jgi:hypothetical protein
MSHCALRVGGVASFRHNWAGGLKGFSVDDGPDSGAQTTRVHEEGVGVAAVGGWAGGQRRRNGLVWGWYGSGNFYFGAELTLGTSCQAGKMAPTERISVRAVTGHTLNGSGLLGRNVAGSPIHNCDHA